MKNENELSIPRAVRSQQVKKQIYDAAISLLHDYGYEYITVANICKLAHVSTGSFYHYFDSKDTLMANFFIEGYEQFKQAQTAPLDDPIDDIVSFFCSYSDYCQAQGLDFIRHFYTPFNKCMDMRRSMTPSGHYALPSMFETAEKIRAAVNKGILQPDIDANQIADDLCTIEKGCIFEWCICDGSFTIRDLTQRLLRNYLKAYLKN